MKGEYNVEEYFGKVVVFYHYYTQDKDGSLKRIEASAEAKVAEGKGDRIYRISDTGREMEPHEAQALSNRTAYNLTRRIEGYNKAVKKQRTPGASSRPKVKRPAA